MVKSYTIPAESNGLRLNHVFDDPAFVPTIRGH